MMARAAVLACVLAGCWSEPGRPACAAPKKLEPLNSGGFELNPMMTTDRLEIVFSSNRNQKYQIFHARRTSTELMFDAPEMIATPQQTGAGVDAFDPWISPDHLTLRYLVGTGNSGGQAWLAKRASIDLAFDTAHAVPVLTGLAPTPLLHPSLTDDGKTLVFESNDGLYLTHRDSADSEAFSSPTKLTVNVPGQVQGGPWISGDGQTLIYDFNGQTVMQAARAGDDFVDAHPVDAVNDPNSDSNSPWMHPDNQTIVFSSNRTLNGSSTNDFDLWIYCE